jgi:NADP-dependent 3-hydroxy acid dehydrogenase YdfG
MAPVLVGGGAGGVGEGIVLWLLRAGHSVVVPSRSAAKLDQLRARLRESVLLARLTTMVAHAGEERGAQELRERLEREGEAIDVVIASLDGWWEGPRFIEIALTAWDAVVDEMVRTHVVFARTFVPMLLARDIVELVIDGPVRTRDVEHAGARVDRARPDRPGRRRPGGAGRNAKRARLDGRTDRDATTATSSLIVR